MKTEKPAAPEGCAYGPWWDAKWGRWHALVPFAQDSVGNVSSELMIHEGSFGWKPSSAHQSTHSELLRLAAQRDRLLDELQKVRDLQPEGSYVGCKLQALIAEHRGEG